MKKKGNINVQTENIFPIIKQFLYSDHEIFLRELISNAVDATQKLKTLKTIGELNTDIKKLRVEVLLNKEEKTITIRDNGIGMTSKELDKYINQIAFSGAEEFVNKYKDADAKNSIIGHFGLGFYSAFMVAEEVEIITKSQSPNSKPVKWVCDGSPNFTMEETTKKTKGTDVILHIADDSTEFLEKGRLTSILNKYCKFLPVEIKFGTKSEKIDDPKGKKDEKGNIIQIDKVSDNIINNTKPAWTKTPSNLKEEHYKSFYKELYPMEFSDPLFHIHLNVDFPFNLTGILYFPKLKNNLEVQKNKINLYSNQVFITDNVDLVFCIFDEAKMFTQSDSMADVSSFFKNFGKKIVMTSGAEGAYYFFEDDVKHQSAQKIENVLDTTGAGDNFAAGFLDFYLSGKPVDEALKNGNRKAEEVIQQLGPRIKRA